ncbi:MAG TPA: hypothetical protein VHN77_01345 [Phycisphaerales bacterium]|nr:hypothetical protein [Phycisphaerales bacterium]
MQRERSPHTPDLGGHGFDVADIHGVLIDGLRGRAGALDEEQAVQGIDALSEVALHAVLADVLRERGFGVLRERPYPGHRDMGRPGERPTHAARMRCDLVLTPAPGVTLGDPVADLRERDALEGTLFAGAELKPVKPTLPPEDALWLEVKTLGQFCFKRGVPVPNTTYAAELTQAVFDDLAKLSHEPLIRHGALVLVLFTCDKTTAEHDVGVAMHRALDKGVVFRSPITGGFEISDRIGNAWCAVVVVGSVGV